MPDPPLSITVLIPAHDEEAGIAAALRSVAASDYPRHLLRALVIADNCTDATAAVARREGAEVVERTDPDRRGKGHALAFGIAHALRERPDAVFVLDADCTVDSHILRRVSDELAAGARAVQAAVVSRADSTAAAFVAAIGTAVDNAAAAGRSRMGGFVPLRGTGMAFRRDLLGAHPWAAHGPAEDAEYSGVLRAAGVAVRFIPNPCVRCEAPTGTHALLVQRRRWRSAMAARGLDPFTRLTLSKPLVLLHLMLTAVFVPLFAPTPLTLTWTGAVVLLTTAVYAAAIARVGRPRLQTLGGTVALVGRLAGVAVAGLWRRTTTWHRTPRG